MKYIDEIIRATKMLSDDQRTLFLGQSVSYPGNVIYKTLQDVPENKKIEMPVFEDTQMGISIGLSLQGFIPVSIFPRFNFLVLALNQLVNHLDKIPHISKRKLLPKVIVKTMVGSIRPLHPGVQHCSDFSDAFSLMMDEIEVIKLKEPEQIFDSYHKALYRDDGKSTILVEYGDFYNEK